MLQTDYLVAKSMIGYSAPGSKTELASDSSEPGAGATSFIQTDVAASLLMEIEKFKNVIFICHNP